MPRPNLSESCKKWWDGWWDGRKVRRSARATEKIEWRKEEERANE